MAKAVVTGGAGFIGSHICEQLLAAGERVLVIDNLSSGRRGNLPAGVEFHELDIRAAAARNLMADFAPDVVVHAAAQMSVTESMKDPVYDAEVNICGMLSLLHAFQGRSLPYWVFLSTGGAIYGEQDYFPADERHPIRPTSVYGAAKRAAELYLELWQRVYGLRFAALRLSNVYGPRQNPHGEAGVVAIFCRRLLNGETPVIYGDGRQTRDFVFVGDVCRAVMKVCERRVQGVYNIGTGRESTVNQVYREIAAVLGSQTAARYEGVRPGEQRRSCIDAASARRVFDWAPELDLAAGLKVTAAWFRDHGRAAE